MAATGYFWLRRANPLFAIIPLTFFLVTRFTSPPPLWMMGLLVLHVVIGMKMMYAGSVNVFTYSLYRNWIYFLERVALCLIPLFLFSHLWITRFQGIAGAYYFFAPLGKKIFYTIGIVATGFYVANCLTTLFMSWGITMSRRAERAAAFASWILFAVLVAWSLRVVFMVAGKG